MELYIRNQSGDFEPLTVELYRENNWHGHFWVLQDTKWKEFGEFRDVLIASTPTHEIKLYMKSVEHIKFGIYCFDFVRNRFWRIDQLARDRE